MILYLSPAHIQAASHCGRATAPRPMRMARRGGNASHTRLEESAPWPPRPSIIFSLSSPLSPLPEAPPLTVQFWGSLSDGRPRSYHSPGHPML